MKKEISILKLFENDAKSILSAREKAKLLHDSSDIKASGNEIEVTIRNFLKRILAPKYYVSHGHLIDVYGKVSPQLDIIISDNNKLPSLFTAEDGTEYIPIDSVFAIGEIKSSYYKSKNYIRDFSNTIQNIKEVLYHEESINTAYGGISDKTTMRDIFLESNNRILNRIYSFMFFVDGSKFQLTNEANYLNTRDNIFLPNQITMLNKGLIFYGSFDEKIFSINKYPEDVVAENEDWIFGPQNIAGMNLALFYQWLLTHLENSHLERPGLDKYFSDFGIQKDPPPQKAKNI